MAPIMTMMQQSSIVFARGAPAMLTENVQPTKLVVNGAYGYMHSLSFSEEG